MRALRLSLVVAAGALVLLLPAPGASARTCKKLKEQRGCRLPAGSGFASTGNVFTITVGRRATDVNGRFTVRCTGGGQPDADQEVEWPTDRHLNFGGRPRIGPDYGISQTTVKLPDSSGKSASYSWDGELTVRSARRASLKLSYTSTYGSTETDTRTCTGSATKTLRRVTYL